MIRRDWDGSEGSRRYCWGYEGSRKTVGVMRWSRRDCWGL